MIAQHPGSPPPDLPSAAPTAGGALLRAGAAGIVWRARRSVLATTLAGLVLAIGYLWQATPLYESAARLFVQPVGPRIIGSDAGTAALQMQEFLYTQAEILTSRDLLATVADELRSAGIDPAGVPSFMTESGPIDPASYLDANVFVDVGRRSAILTIRVRSPYAGDARDLANAVVRAFYAYHQSQQQGTSQDILKLLFAQKQKHETELEGMRAEKLEFLRRHRLLAPGEARVNPALERLTRLSNALTEVEIDALQAQAAYESTRAIADDEARIRALLDTRQFKSETENLRRELRDLKRRLAGLSGQYLPGFPELAAIQATLRQLHEELALEDRRVFDAYLAELEQRLATARRMEDELRQHVQAQRAQVLELNDVAAQHQILDAQIAALERANDAIDARIKELSLTEQAAPFNIQTIERAREHANPVEPVMSRTLFYGLAGGLIAGVLLALVRDGLDQRLRGVDEIRQLLELPVLGVLPHIDGAGVAERGLAVHLDPMSGVAECFRTVRTGVYFSAPGATARTLLITSPEPGEGKSTLASNLAVAMAQAGHRVLLVDADLRKPVQHAIFGIDDSPGLCGLLAARSPDEQAIRATSVPGLSLLACGPIPANPAEILGSEMFRDLLSRLGRRFDTIVLDSPPVSAVTDARILAASCDATLLALRAGRSARRAAVHARDLLASVGATILGIVVNDVPRRGDAYASYTAAFAPQYRYGRRARSGAAGTAETPAAASAASANGER